MSDVKISELDHLPGTFTDIDDLLIPIDDGQRTYCVTVEEFNDKGTESAYNYSQIAADAAGDAMTYKNNAAASASSAATAVIQATNAKTSAETAESNALAYKNAAESAKNDAIAAKNAINTAGATCTAAAETATAAATAATSAKELAQTAASTATLKAALSEDCAFDSEAFGAGSRGLTPVTSEDPAYQNNAKYYNEQAAASATSAASDAQTCATAVVKNPYIYNGHWYVWSWDDNAYIDTNINATGPTGNGIVSTTKTSSSGKVDTYTILYTNGATDTFTVTNGEDGQGSGDMLMTDYDHDQDVFNAGGIPAYTSGAISTYNTNTVSPALNNKMAKDGSNADRTVDFTNIRMANSASYSLGEHCIAVGNDVLAYGERIVAHGDSVSAFGNNSHAEGKNDSTIKKHVICTDKDYGGIMDSGDSIQVIFPGVAYGDRIVFTVDGTLVYDGIRSEYQYPSISTSTTYYTVALNRGSSQSSHTSDTMRLTITAREAIASDSTTVHVKVEAYSDVNAFGEGAHSEGEITISSGKYSHSEGLRTEAGYDYQHVSGKYNSNKSTTLFEVGNGTADNARSNAFEVYSDGTFSQNNGTDKYKFAKSGGLDGFYDGSGNFHPLVNLYLEQSVTLSTSADTTVTFTNAGILATSRIDAYSSDYTIVPSNVVASAGSCTVTFEKADTASTITVGIEVKN